jgi:acyl-CoA thioester hydrolase
MARGDFILNHVIVPRFRDTDAMGHINNAVYVTYLEVGRQAYWAALVGRDDYRSVPFILASVTCDFRSEALVDEVLEIGLRCDRIGGKSFGFRYEIRARETGRVVVEATSVQVCYDYGTKRSIAMPAGLRTRLEAFEGRPLASADPV